MYGKLPTDPPDPLMLEAVVRHGFDLWIPSEVIKRIQASPSPGQRLLALARVMSFLEPKEIDGVFAIKRQFRGALRRKVQIAARLGGYFFSTFPVVFALRTMGDLEEPMSIILCALLAVVFTILCFYLFNSACELHRLSSVAARYPDLFQLNAESTPDAIADASSATPWSIARTAPRWTSWTARSLRTQSEVQPEVLRSEAPTNRSTSAPSTPRA
jgi:hypothetical protein